MSRLYSERHMRSQHHSTATNPNMKTNNYMKSLLAVLGATFIAATSTNGQTNLLTNPRFEIPDPRVPNGEPYTAAKCSYTAAANWTFADNGDQTVPHTTQLSESSAPNGQETMICVATSGQSDGLYQYFRPFSAPGVNQVHVGVWVYVTTGRVTLYTGRAGGTSSSVNSTTTNQWELLQIAPNDKNITGIFIYASSPGGAQFCADNAFVFAAADCVTDIDADGVFDCVDPDDDNDGVVDAADNCPESDLHQTVVVGGVDTGVPNTTFPNGCTISDRIDSCAQGADVHGGFVSCVAELTNQMNKSGVMSGRQKGAIQSASGQSKE